MDQQGPAAQAARSSSRRRGGSLLFGSAAADGQSGIPFLLSGTYALASYTGIDRPTKDVDVFAKAGDALKMLPYFKEHGFDVEIVDERWLARITRGELFVDVIYNMPTVTTHVTDEWFEGAPETRAVRGEGAGSSRRPSSSGPRSSSRTTTATTAPTSRT